MATLGSMAVGSIVKIKVDGTAQDFIIVHQGKPSSMYDSSCDGTWVLMKKCYGGVQFWDYENNDYKNSNIKSLLDSTFYNLVDVDMQKAIKTVKIPYHNSTGNEGGISSGSNGLSCKIFLLSGYELGWTTSTDEELPVDGACLSYFKGTSTKDDRRKANDWWWLRSPAINSAGTAVWAVNKLDGSLHTHSVKSYSHPARPAFVLPPSCPVDTEGVVIGNTLPTITSDTASGSDMGEISAPFDLTYTINDEDGDTVTVTEYLDDVQTRTFTATLGVENTFEAVSDPVLFQKILNGQHTIKIIANDTKDNSEPYTITFNKQVKSAVITLRNPLPADDVIKAAVISVSGNIPQDATLEVLVTNNALDENPVWEDMTQDFEKKINHVFANKTAANGFAFNFKVTATRGASGEQGFISSIGGAFE